MAGIHESQNQLAASRKRACSPPARRDTECLLLGGRPLSGPTATLTRWSALRRRSALALHLSGALAEPALATGALGPQLRHVLAGLGCVANQHLRVHDHLVPGLQPGPDLSHLLVRQADLDLALLR